MIELRDYIPSMSKKEKPKRDIISANKKGRYEYEILDTFEAGIVLLGSEVKSLRGGKANIAEGYAAVDGDEVFIHGLNIPIYKQAGKDNHQPKRPRKLLLHRSEISKIIGKVKEKGLTLVPLNLYFNPKGLVKIEIGVGKGKKLHDKRETIKKRDWDRKKGSLLKGE